jgi:hypothetical protein
MFRSLFLTFAYTNSETYLGQQLCGLRLFLPFIILKINTHQQNTLHKKVSKFSSEMSSFYRCLENKTGNVLVIYLVTLVGDSILGYWLNYK